MSGRDDIPDGPNGPRPSGAPPEPPVAPLSAGPSQWPAAHPFPGPPPQPFPPGHGRLNLILSVVLALLVVGVGAMTVVLASGGASSRSPVTRLGPRPVTEVAADELREAAAAYAATPGMRFTGFMDDGVNGRYDVDLQVTNAGAVTGTLRQGGDSFQLTVVDGRTFFKGGAAFWQKAGLERKRADVLAKKWVRIDPIEVGLDVEGLLIPAELGLELTALARANRIEPGRTAEVNGVPVREVSTPLLTASVTTAAPHRIVAISSTAASTTRATPRVVPSRYSARAGGEFRLFVERMPADQVARLLADMTARLQELRGSVDSQVEYTGDPKVTLAPCGNSTCQANVTVENKFRSRSPYLKADQPMEALVEVRWTFDGRPIGRPCAGEVTVPARATRQVQFQGGCRVNYVVPRDNRTHSVVAEAEILVSAVVRADVEKLGDDLARQSKAFRLCTAGPHGLPGWSPRHGPVRFEPANWRPGQDLKPQPGGGYLDADGNVWTLGRPSWAIAGVFSKEWDVQLSASGARAWANRGWPIARDGNHANITPDGYDSHGKQPDRTDIPHCDNN